MTPEYLKALSWYRNHENNGRGRIFGITAKMLKNGHITRTQTSFYGWVLRLTPTGRAVLDQSHD